MSDLNNKHFLEAGEQFSEKQEREEIILLEDHLFGLDYRVAQSFINPGEGNAYCLDDFCVTNREGEKFSLPFLRLDIYKYEEGKDSENEKTYYICMGCGRIFTKDKDFDWCWVNAIPNVRYNPDQKKETMVVSGELAEKIANMKAKKNVDRIRKPKGKSFASYYANKNKYGGKRNG